MRAAGRKNQLKRRLILIRNGRIVARGRGVDFTEDVLFRDGLIVAPGFVDIHTHLRDPRLRWLRGACC